MDNFLHGHSWKLQWYMVTGKAVIKNAKGAIDWARDCRIDEKGASSYSMDTDASYCSTELSCNERKKWDYLSRQQCSSARKGSINETRWRSCQGINQSLKNNKTNPSDCSFLDHNVLINISTGMHATEEGQSSLLNAVKNGKDQMEAFVTRTFSEAKRQSLYGSVSKLGVKTFGDMAEETKIKVHGQIKRGIISSETVFRRALTLANCRQDVTLETVLTHPVCPLPTSMFHDDGTMRKCVKADLAHGLQDGVNSLVDLNNTNKDLSVLICDAMAIIQATQTSYVKMVMILERRTFRTWCWNLKKQRLWSMFLTDTTLLILWKWVGCTLELEENTMYLMDVLYHHGKNFSLSLLTRNLWLISYVIT